jgi:hypothetical protein
MYFIGFFTYAGWIVTVHFWLAVLFVYRKDIKTGYFFHDCAFTAAATVIALCFFFKERPYHRACHGLVIREHIHYRYRAGILGIWFDIFDTCEAAQCNFPFFTKPAIAVLCRIPAFYGRHNAGCAHSRKKLNHILLIGLCFSCATFFIMNPFGHHLRHAAFITFVMTFLRLWY